MSFVHWIRKVCTLATKKDLFPSWSANRISRSFIYSLSPATLYLLLYTNFSALSLSLSLCVFVLISIGILLFSFFIIFFFSIALFLSFFFSLSYNKVFVCIYIPLMAQRLNRNSIQLGSQSTILLRYNFFFFFYYKYKKILLCNDF